MATNQDEQYSNWQQQQTVVVCGDVTPNGHHEVKHVRAAWIRATSSGY
jgi:hypothetical protein